APAARPCNRRFPRAVRQPADATAPRATSSIADCDKDAAWLPAPVVGMDEPRSVSVPALAQGPVHACRVCIRARAAVVTCQRPGQVAVLLVQIELENGAAVAKIG